MSPGTNNKGLPRAITEKVVAPLRLRGLGGWPQRQSPNGHAVGQGKLHVGALETGYVWSIVITANFADQYSG